MTEYDSPWKDILDQFFPAFMEFCFPQIFVLIDWSVPPKMLDKEFQQITPHGELGRRSVDKLVEVRLLSGEIEWILIHLEIQNQRIEDFTERMFVYFYRIRDKHNQRVVSLAVLGDENPNWRPDTFQQDTLGCKVQFSYPLIKLNDFLQDMTPLEKSNNPVASLILAHLLAMQTTGKPIERHNGKLRVFRLLCDRGFDSQVLRKLYRVIDWMLELPLELECSFREELRKIEETHEMPYIPSYERLAHKEGLEEGREKGREEGREEGVLAGKIQILQQMLDQPVASTNELLAEPLEALERKIEGLMKELRSA